MHPPIGFPTFPPIGQVIAVTSLEGGGEGVITKNTSRELPFVVEHKFRGSRRAKVDHDTLTCNRMRKNSFHPWVLIIIWSTCSFGMR
ncbi:hypothetical protein JTE90_012600 [Oedothorax gibbosus]|uniref:Uncharacterized protein n=1 Tax=Oedothorax gibbosus TaxID=931172 RepID=A0AAV6V353_9ARAC|nr:hypothetical protein JTE90_012600 [Oedothorax gibbosus]